MNKIYFFTGTGNSLKAAKEIAKALPGCELAAIHKGAGAEIPTGCERLGFVFPSYAGGPPAMVAEFIRKLKLPRQGRPYLFAAVSYGGNARDVLPLVAGLFEESGLPLDYAAKIIAYPNALPKIGLLFRVIDGRTKKATPVAAGEIAGKKRTTYPAPKAPARQFYNEYMASIHSSDEKYSLNQNCISCGICQSLCPAKNITMENGGPTFHHSCESCLACVNYCPRHAINTGNKEQDSRRYTNLQVTHSHIAQYYTE